MIKKLIRPFVPFMLILLALFVAVSGVFGSAFSDSEAQSEVIDASASKDGEDVFSVLVVGKDKVSSLADVIMLVSFDRSSKRACVLQIPRDTYASYGNKNYYKINGALRTLGADGMRDFFEKNFGIALDGYISLDLEGFRNVVDAIGGVEITVEEDLKYNDPSQGLYINLKKGRQTLDGKHAEMLVRYRSGYARGDLDRLDTQKEFMAATFLGVKKKINLLNAYGVISSVIPYIETDISAPELLSLFVSGTAVSDDDIGFITLPGEDAISDISGGSFYVMSAKSTKKILNENFRVTDENFDADGRFLHNGIKKFAQIYNDDKETEAVFIKDLK